MNKGGIMTKNDYIKDIYSISKSYYDTVEKTWHHTPIAMVRKQIEIAIQNGVEIEYKISKACGDMRYTHVWKIYNPDTEKIFLLIRYKNGTTHWIQDYIKGVE